MGEVYGLAALALAVAGAGWLVLTKVLTAGAPRINKKGRWEIAEFSGVLMNEGFTKVCLLRMDGKHETARIDVGTVYHDDEDWQQHYEALQAEARQRLSSLQANK